MPRVVSDDPSLDAQGHTRIPGSVVSPTPGAVRVGAMAGGTQTTFSKKIDAATTQRLKDMMEKGGFEFRTVPYARFSGKGEGVTCTVYESGKCVVQGRGTGQFVGRYLAEYAEPEEAALEATLEFTETVLGSDEAGKGDYFGPLVVAAAAFGPEHLPLLDELGFKDSKLMGARRIREVAARLRESLPHEIVRVNPPRYNQLYTKFRNLNKLLAWCHGKALHELSQRTDAKIMVVDQFCSERVLMREFPPALKSLRLELRPRAESVPAVAAASVLASDAFTRGIQKLSRDVDLTLPKGAGAPVMAAAKRLVAVKGKRILADVAKLHFNLTDRL